MSDQYTLAQVKWFDEDKGFGFLIAEGVEKDVFVHAKQLRKSGIDGPLEQGDHVRFVLGQGDKGNFATKIEKVNDSSQP